MPHLAHDPRASRILPAAAALLLMLAAPLAGAHLTNPNGSWTSAKLTGDDCRYGGSLADNGGTCPLNTNSAAVSGTYVGAAHLAFTGDVFPASVGPFYTICAPGYCTTSGDDVNYGREFVAGSDRDHVFGALCGLEVIGPGRSDSESVDFLPPGFFDGLLNEPVVSNDASGGHDDQGILPTPIYENWTKLWQGNVYRDGTWDDGGYGGACHVAYRYGESDYNSFGCSGTSHAEDSLSAGNVWVMPTCDDSYHVGLGPIFCLYVSYRAIGADCITGTGGLRDEATCLILRTCAIGDFLACGADGSADFANLGEGGGDRMGGGVSPLENLSAVGSSDSDPDPAGQGVPYPVDTAHPECANLAAAATYVLDGVEANAGTTASGLVDRNGDGLVTAGRGEGATPNADYALAAGGWIDWTPSGGESFDANENGGGLAVDTCEAPLPLGPFDSVGDLLNPVAAAVNPVASSLNFGPLPPPCPGT